MVRGIKHLEKACFQIFLFVLLRLPYPLFDVGERKAEVLRRSSAKTRSAVEDSLSEKVVGSRARRRAMGFLAIAEPIDWEESLASTQYAACWLIFIIKIRT